MGFARLRLDAFLRSAIGVSWRSILTRLPQLNSREMERVLLKLGFVAVRQKGSHVFFRHLDGRATSLPNHPGRPLAKGLLRSILRDIELTPDALREMLG
jgi:predicted RNA binding protein YcfA (HicA-like mRNA interferase family)